LSQGLARLAAARASAQPGSGRRPLARFPPSFHYGATGQLSTLSIIIPHETRSKIGDSFGVIGDSQYLLDVRLATVATSWHGIIWRLGFYLPTA